MTHVVALHSQTLSLLWEYHAPAPGNVCKNSGCGGRMVRRVIGFFDGEFTYSFPKCEQCGRFYMRAQNAPGVGSKEFLENYRQSTNRRSI